MKVCLNIMIYELIFASLCSYISFMLGSSTQEQTADSDLPHGGIEQQHQNMVAEQSTGTSVLKHVGHSVYFGTP